MVKFKGATEHATEITALALQRHHNGLLAQFLQALELQHFARLQGRHPDDPALERAAPSTSVGRYLPSFALELKDQGCRCAAVARCQNSCRSSQGTGTLIITPPSWNSVHSTPAWYG